MTRYRLPDALGGGEYELIDSLRGWIRVDVTGVGPVRVPATACTEVPPPIPAEPIAAKDGLSYYVDRYGLAWQNSIHHAEWQSAANDRLLWAELWEQAGPLRPLVALPEVELPWLHEGMSVGRVGRATVKANIGKSFLNMSADEAEATAAALLTAARAARSKP